MSEFSLPFSLPRSGPFEVAPEASSASFQKAIVFLLIFLPLAGVSIHYAVKQVSHIRETKRIWEKGSTTSFARFQGRITTHNLVFKVYRIRMFYMTRRSQKVRKLVTFVRLFSGPGKKDPFQIRYLPNEPKKAMISWGYDSIGHSWILVLFLCGLAGLFLFFPIKPVKKALEAQRLKALAAKGELLWVKVEESEPHKDLSSKKEGTRYTFKLDAEKDEIQEHISFAEEDEPLLDEEGKHLAVLVAKQTSQHQVLHHNGFPLSFSSK